MVILKKALDSVPNEFWVCVIAQLALAVIIIGIGIIVNY
jgi:hypothetical protein